MDSLPSFASRSFCVATLLLVAAIQNARSSPVAPSYSYQLIEGSSLVDDCPPCARPTRLEPLRGRFDLRLVAENPLFATYEMENIAFTAGGIGRTYKISGRGTYVVGGEVALRQELFLELRINDGVSNRLCYLTNDTPIVGRLWPIVNLRAKAARSLRVKTTHL